MAKMARTEPQRFGLFRLCFPNLLKAQERDRGNPQFNAVLVYADGDPVHDALKGAIAAAVTAQWGDKGMAELKKGADSAIALPFRSGNKGNYAERPGFGEGTTFIRAVSELPPGVVGRDPSKPFRDADIVEKAYPGCYVYAVLHAWTWDHPSNGKGVSFGLDAIQVAKDGERLGGGGVDTSRHFETLPEEAGAEGLQGSRGAGAAFDTPF